MLRFIGKRILTMIPVLLGVSILIFTMVYFTPADAADMLLGDGATEEDRQILREELKLDEPYLTRYLDYMKGVLHGDLGTSYSTKRPVLEELLDRFPTTLKLASLGVLFAVVVGVTAGIISATKQYSIFDVIFSGISIFGVSVPNFWLGLMLILIFSVNLGIFPPSGFTTPLHYVLPMVSLGFNSCAIIMRTTRSSMLEVIRQDYIRTARAKGQKEWKVTLFHALPNALIPVITVIGLQFGRLLGGAVLTESVFSIAGIGNLLVNGIKQRNAPLVQGGVLFTAFVMTIVNLCVDILYGFADPRIRSQYVRRKNSNREEVKKNGSSDADE